MVKISREMKKIIKWKIEKIIEYREVGNVNFKKKKIKKIKEAKI